MVKLADYAGLKPAWCPGCGDFGILNAVKKALVELELAPHQVLLVSGIGQAGKLPHYTRGNTFNTLHGRTLPAAAAAKMVNPELVVIAVGGDGDGYGEGGNHWLHTMRRNHQITYLVHDNQVYGLTKGQASPTSDQGFVTKSTPEGAAEPVHPLGIAMMAGATLVARGFSADIGHLADLIKQGVKHRGFALIDILQPCVSFNFKNTYQWYQERVYKLEGETGYDPTNFSVALEKAQEWGDKIPIGVIYKTERPTFEDQLPALKKGPLVKQRLVGGSVQKLMDEFM